MTDPNLLKQLRYNRTYKLDDETYERESQRRMLERAKLCLAAEPLNTVTYMGVDVRMFTRDEMVKIISLDVKYKDVFGEGL